jgi:hypothetical protein
MVDVAMIGDWRSVTTTGMRRIGTRTVGSEHILRKNGTSTVCPLCARMHRYRDTFILKERAKKTRKLTRGLCEFTGVPSEGERKCKGWSDEGMVAFENHVKEIRTDEEEGKHVAWEKAYRNVMEKLGHAQRDSEEPFQKARCEPNLAVVYEGF